MKELFNLFLFDPLYNSLVFLINVIPGADVGVAVIVLTIIVKLILFPLSIKATRTNLKMKLIQKPLEEIKLKYKDNREEMGRAMLALYKEHKINPLSSFVVLLIQIPVVLALYFVFLKGGLPVINGEILYSFIHNPEIINMHFLGLVNVGESKSVVLALLAALTQHLQARFAFPKPEKKPEGHKNSFQEDMVKGMGVQIKYVFPFIIFFVSYSLISVAALYWTISNIFAIGQELYIRKTIRKPEEEREKLAVTN
jgi:YidC/Oxa1 family membrane protein insertase